MKKLLALLLFLIPAVAHAQQTVSCNPVPYIFAPGTTIPSAQFNANFAAVVACINAIPLGTATVATATTTNASPVPPAVVTVNVLTTFRNRFINGGMAIDQRHAGAAQNAITSGVTFLVDRMFYKASQAGKWNAQQTATTNPLPSMPSNFQETMTVAAAATPAAGDYYAFGQAIESINLQDMSMGTANAEPASLSFWANSSSPCTCSGAIIVNGYSFVFNYTLVANTWTRVTIPVAANTVSTGDADVYLSLGCGATYQATPGSWVSGTFYCSGAANSNLVSISGETLNVTAMQFEPGTNATPFEQRTAGVELGWCQRYHQKVAGWKVGRYTSAGGTVPVPSFSLNSPMRAQPTGTPSSTSFTGGCSGISLTPTSSSSVQATLTGCSATSDITGAATLDFDAEMSP